MADHKVVCFGEVLWDILPSGSVPGGAPMNVAYHLHKQRKDPAIITRIGKDEKGDELIRIFSDHGLCIDFFQFDNIHETGKVYAMPNEHNEVVYDIVKPVAWDFIETENRHEALVSGADYFVFGSLAARSPQSRKTLLRLLEFAKIKVLDINLRPPHFDKTIVEELLSKTDFLKLNLSELELITSWYSKYTSITDNLRSISDKFKIQNMVVTMGGDGAILQYNGHANTHKGFKVKVADTVGSGDAFLAGLLAKLLDKASPAETLEFASRLGSFIATKKGACPDYNVEEIIV
ncbi:MAG: carbohydrate kinase [Bacteroidota bacterium]|nr:carbohydrate kinase [Bacteroidota bacterium]